MILQEAESGPQSPMGTQIKPQPAPGAGSGAVLSSSLGSTSFVQAS